MAKKDFAATSKGQRFTVPNGHCVGTSPYLAMNLPDVLKNPDKVKPFRGQGRQHMHT